jgi:hypothetical protein
VRRHKGKPEEAQESAREVLGNSRNYTGTPRNLQKIDQGKLKPMLSYQGN